MTDQIILCALSAALVGVPAGMLLFALLSSNRVDDRLVAAYVAGHADGRTGQPISHQSLSEILETRLCT